MRNTAGNLLLWTIGTLLALRRLERLELPLFAILLHKEVGWYSRPLCVALLHLALQVFPLCALFFDAFEGRKWPKKKVECMMLNPVWEGPLHPQASALCPS